MDEDDDEPVPLPNVNAAILKKVGSFIPMAFLDYQEFLVKDFLLLHIR